MRTGRILFHVYFLLLLLFVGGCETVSSHSQTAASFVHAPADHATIKHVATPSKGPIANVPVRLLISSVGINAPIESVGIESTGDLSTPTRKPWEDVGWYDMGTYPGERGSAVIDGHLDRPGGYPAVFWRLRDVHSGDQIAVLTSTGETLRFRVTSLAYYTPNQAPIQNIFGNSGGIYLNLITCAGDWIPDQHQTTLRLVVYTTAI